MGEPLTPEEEAALRRVVAEDVAAVYRSDVAALLATLDAARAAAPAGETDTTPAGDPEMPHVPKPSDICSDCGRGLVHVIPSLDPPAPVQAAGLREAPVETLMEWLHDLVGTQHYITHETGYDGDDFEGVSCIDGLESHREDAEQLAALIASEREP